MGIQGTGPAQLALALLLAYTDDAEVALAEYTAFKTEIVSSAPDRCWRLTGREVDVAPCEAVDESVAPSVDSQTALLNPRRR